MKMNKWITLPSLGVVLLILLQTSVSFIRDLQAGWYVDRIHGVQAGPVEDNGVLIKWGENTQAPSCPVTLDFVFEHESGFAFVEQPEVEFSTEFHTVVAKSKNGHTSFEPIGEDAVKIIKSMPGEWRYKIQFKFDCAFVKNEWISWITFDKIHTIEPVIITIGGTSQ